ncbi:MAG: AraC family transcriptional regulator [Bacteroidales bacterium]|nr:AraC family transcriptional regulator [Bacteroidales bacterium]
MQKKVFSLLPQCKDHQTILQAKILLKHSDLMVCEIANRLNFQELTAFVRFFKKQTGMPPKVYQRD